MKKIIAVLFIVFVCCFSCYAEQTAKIKFIYLNGSNANTEEKKQDFSSGIFDVQRTIKHTFEKDDFICKNFLKSGVYKIDEIPEIFFWGFYSKNDLRKVKELLGKTQKTSTLFAQYFRNSIVNDIHDIIWIKREENLKTVINDLHKSVLCSKQRGEKVVLLGHSAGAFITYAYILNKIKDFDTDFLETGLTGAESKRTCFDAIIASEMGIKSAEGRLIRNPDDKAFLRGYKNIDAYTNQECVPDDLVLGVINFGSPLPLFFPNRLNEPWNNAYIYQSNLLDYIYNNNLFFLTVNFAEDTLSMVSDNYSKISENNGFVYTYMKEKSPSSFISAHYTYWKYPKKFTKIIINGYKEGFLSKNICKN